MKKIVKILLVVFILSLILCSFYSVKASDINMNLSTNDSTTYGSNTANNTNNTINNSQDSSVLVSSTPSNALDGLTFSDMINIVLCAIGIVLILLGIAILIRQKAQ